MTRPDTSLDLRRLATTSAASVSSTPASSPKGRQPVATPRKTSRLPTTPGGGGTSARTPSFRSTRSALAAATALALSRPDKARSGAGTHRSAAGGTSSEPSSPRLAENLPLGTDDPLALLRSEDSGSPGRGSDDIKVYVRVRPHNARERGSSGAAPRSCVSIRNKQVVLSDPSRPDAPFCATYDHVFPPEASQEELFSSVGAEMVENVIAGFNSSVFVYGQTGSGKTHTITGDVERAEDGALGEQCGLTLRVFSQLFDRITDEERDGVRYFVKCYYCEIYNEEITDLLAPGRSGLQIRDGDQHKGVYVEDLSEHVAVNADDVMRLIKKGSANRHTAATRMNERSSRSHSVFTAVVEAHEEQSDCGVTNVRFAKLNLIDLAGSERVGKSGATGDQLTEAKSINKSLTTLGRVVTALTERQQHVPYRDSRLTFLLKESLGGNSKTAICACISPSDDSAQETHSTLVFASGAKKIKNKAVVNHDTLGDMKALQLENARLRAELAKQEDVRTAELRQQLAAAQEQAVSAKARIAEAEQRQQQLEVALNENHASLQQRNAELLLLRKEMEENKATCQLLQRDREQLIDHNAALTERVDQLQEKLEDSVLSLKHAKQEAAEHQQRCEAAVASQHAAEEEARSLMREGERLAADVARAAAELESTRQAMAAELAQAQAAVEDGERCKKSLKREVEQLLSDLRKRQREVADTQELAAAREERLRQEIAELNESVASRTMQLHELESKLASETVCTAKYRRMVGEIGKLIDWAQSTSPLPPTLGGRTSPAGYSSLSFGRLSFGTNGASPLGDATAAANMLRRASLGALPLSARQAPRSPPKHGHTASPVAGVGLGLSPPLNLKGSPPKPRNLWSPTKVR